MRALVLLVVLTSVAHAQAPGQVVASEPSTVMTRRWGSICRSAASRSPQSTPVRRRSASVGSSSRRGSGIRPAIEVALAFEGAGNQGISTAGFFAEFRYRFMAERPWTPFALAGLGVQSAADKTGTDTEKKGRGALRIGGGIERRFGAWGSRRRCGSSV